VRPLAPGCRLPQGPPARVLGSDRLAPIRTRFLLEDVV
jgi:hypothetical protein